MGYILTPLRGWGPSFEKWRVISRQTEQRLPYTSPAIGRRACAAAPARLPHIIPVRRRVRTILAVVGSTLALVYVASAGCGRGGHGYFSPDTLDCRAHSEWLLPLVDLPVYRGPSSTYRYPAADWLVAQGYWSKSDASDPRWLTTFQWNQQWWDGYSSFHCELGRNGDRWVQWSKDHPEMAKALWPKVLTTLRKPGVTSTGDAMDLMFAAQHAASVEEFEKLAAKLAARPRG